MIEIDNLTKACGLLAFQYWTFPSPRFDNVPESATSAATKPPPGVGAPEPPPATFPAAPARTEPRLERAISALRPEPEPVPAGSAKPAPQSVLHEVAATLSPAPPTLRSGRASRTARSA